MRFSLSIALLLFVNQPSLMAMPQFCVNHESDEEINETFDNALEQPVLQNIEQLTFASMGFEKAGEAYFSPDGETIIFQAVPKGEKQYQIYTMSISERIPRLVSTGKGACTCAFFRPDGKKIIFASSHEDPAFSEGEAPGYQRNGSNYHWVFTPYMNIYEANPDGSELKALTSGPAYHAECSYSPDGAHIVYASNEHGNMNLYIMNSDGTDVRQITFAQKGYSGGPFFSPDGKKILFRADYRRQDYLQIYVVNVDGTGLKHLTNNEFVNWSPFWHPNGKVIALTTSIHGHQHYEIYVLNIVTYKYQRVTYNATFDGLPVFNREANKMMWTSKRGLDGTSQIFMADFTLPNELE